MSSEEEAEQWALDELKQLKNMSIDQVETYHGPSKITDDWIAFLVKMKATSETMVNLITQALDIFLSNAPTEEEAWPWIETHFWPKLELIKSEDKSRILGVSLPGLPPKSTHQ